jgi:multidrug efflux pump subunit AcrB
VIAIFVPVVFMRGVVGKFFLQFGVTLSIAVLLSYVEAVTLAPARCSQMLSTSREGRGRIGRAADRLFERLAAAYSWLLVRGLRRPLTVLAAAVAIFAVSLGIFTRLKSEFVPSQDQSRLLVRLQTAVGSDLEETDRVFRRAETFLLSRPEVIRVFGVVGGFGGGEVNSGRIFATLRPPDERMPQAEFAAILRKELNSYPGVRAIVQDLSQQGFTAQRGFPVEFSVQGPDWDELVTLSTGVMEQLRASGAVIDLDSDYDVGMPELAITPDRARCADAGVSVSDVATTINTLVGGARVGK